MVVKERSGPADDGGVASPSSAPDTEPLAAVDPDRLERTGRRWLIWSFILCPCHLPWTMAALAAVFGGTAFGALVTANATTVGVLIGLVYAVGVGIGFRYIRRATAERNCAAGSCTVDPP